MADCRIKAQYLIDKKLSVIPVKKDGSKLPSIKWKVYQDRLMTPEEVNVHFADCGGIALLTGALSQVFLLDFDLKYDAPSTNTYHEFMKKVPASLSKHFLINRTMSGGYHIWLRTSYTDRSRKITRRELTLREFGEKVLSLQANGANEKTAMGIILNNPYEVTLETRANASYGLFSHPSYTLVQKSETFLTGLVPEGKVEFLLNIGYELDCRFTKRKKIYVGDTDSFKVVNRFNDDCTAEGTVGMLEKQGLYNSIGTDHNGNHLMRRVGSESNHSAYVYGNSGIFRSFGLNTLNSDKETLTPFEIFCEVEGLQENEAISIIQRLRQKDGK